MAGRTVTKRVAERVRNYRERPEPLPYSSIGMILGISKRAAWECARRGYTSAEESYLLKRGKQPPANYAQLLEVHSYRELEKLLGVCSKTLTRWTARLGLELDTSRFVRGKPSPMRKPLPEGFRAFYEANGWSATKRHYGLSTCLTNRFVHETGGPMNPRVKPAETSEPANDIITPPPGYEEFKRKLGRPRDMYGMAA